MLSVWMDVYKDIDFVVAVAAAVNPPHKVLRKWRLPISRHFLMGNAALSYQIYPLKRSPPKCPTSDTTKQLSSGLVNRGRKVKNNAAQLKKSFLVVHYTSSYEREFNALLSVPFSSSPSPKLVFQKGRKRSVKNGKILPMSQSVQSDIYLLDDEKIQWSPFLRATMPR